ncbi:hypothetical protein LTR56_008724 [Elasticomyces elasticus]|nr:hypothetical protein LTR22_026894 [Elasticomyces elasticus]KAK3646107.1 hypothetical protein LTR56_008724 [Elasticomyces elasticus]KAK4924288.1 hypothetical protein LTR49_008588 [Elasticomyces elasticus]KAK5759154.1 hypothetical protein LTS12_010763 [Elasticomyces elasticus]
MLDTSKLATSSILDTIKGWLGAKEAGLTWVTNLPGRAWTAICNLITTVTDALLDFVIVVVKGMGIALAIYVAFVAILNTACLILYCLQKARPSYEQVARERAACHTDDAQSSHHQLQRALEILREEHQQRQRQAQHEEHNRREAEQARTEESQREHSLHFQDAAAHFRRTEIRRNPEPPDWECDNEECTTTSRVLRACKHNLQELFTSTKDPTTLRKDMILWHPDNAIFAKMENDGHTGAIAYATEIAAVISGLLPTRSG